MSDARDATTTTTTTASDVAPVRPGEELDWDALASYLRTHIDDLDGPLAVLQFPNGSANLTYLLNFGDRQLVLRRPPMGLLAPGAHDMKREFRTLSKLWAAFAPAPRAFLFCDDRDVVGSDFVVMEYRQGEVIWGEIPTSMRHHREVGRRVGFAVVDALAELHLVDPAACGLDTLGRPDGFVERQVRGWQERWQLAAPPGTDSLMAEVGARLATGMPVSTRVSILHNDYKLDNCQFDPTDPDHVRSIFDWDMATLGDPLVDLGILLNYWPDATDAPGTGLVLTPGMDELGLPGRVELIGRYAATTGIEVGDVAWYEAFACWKTAVILQQLHTRYLRGETTDERMAERGEHVPAQARRASSILDAAGVP